MVRCISSSDGPSLTKRLTNGLSNSPTGCFGVRLDELCARDNTNVPLVMIQMCAFLRAVCGLHTKGVFRVNGNSRIIESLRKAADLSTSNEDGNSFLSHLERYGNIHSVASLIKLFLRELPVGLVPPAHTKDLLENYNPNAENSLAIIDRVVRSLPPPNYRLLEYLCCFLRQVTQYHSYNQMDSKSIGIVFGPNVFRCPRETESLSSQNVINEIMSILVEKSDVLFAQTNTLEVPSAPLLHKKHSGGSLSLSPTSTPDETESAIDVHHRATESYNSSRHQRGDTLHPLYYLEPDHPRNTFFQDE
nr:protein fam13a [Hymenolepis microstoma]